MRTSLIALIMEIALLTHVGLAADVGFELEPEALNADSPEKAKVWSEIQLRDRVWAVPGIEEVSRRFDVEGGSSRWMDDVLWPRTRMFFRKGGYNGQVFTFGGIALQR